MKVFKKVKEKNMVISEYMGNSIMNDTYTMLEECGSRVRIVDDGGMTPSLGYEISVGECLKVLEKTKVESGYSYEIKTLNNGKYRTTFENKEKFNYRVHKTASTMHESIYESIAEVCRKELYYGKENKL